MYQASGPFEFSIASGVDAKLKITQTPPNQLCTLSQSSFSTGVDISGIVVNCTAKAATSWMYGTIIGSTGSVELQMNDQKKVFNSNSMFSFGVPLGSEFSFSVSQAPAGQTCTVNEPSGIAPADKRDFLVTCKEGDSVASNVTLSGTTANFP